MFLHDYFLACEISTVRTQALKCVCVCGGGGGISLYVCAKP